MPTTMDEFDLRQITTEFDCEGNWKRQRYNPCAFTKIRGISEEPFAVSMRDAAFVRDLRASEMCRPNFPLHDPGLAVDE